MIIQNHVEDEALSEENDNLRTMIGKDNAER